VQLEEMQAKIKQLLVQLVVQKQVEERKMQEAKRNDVIL
jgi:hypothetical protein